MARKYELTPGDLFGDAQEAYREFLVGDRMAKVALKERAHAEIKNAILREDVPGAKNWMLFQELARVGQPDPDVAPRILSVIVKVEIDDTESEESIAELRKDLEESISGLISTMVAPFDIHSEITRH
jgi:hypothetical protein